MGDESSAVRALRERMLGTLLRVMAVGGVVAYVPSAYLSIREKIWSVLAADSLACAYVLLLALLPRVSYRLKVGSILAISYLLGLLLLVATGPFGAGHLFVFAFVFLVALFGDLKAMIAANLLAILTHAGIALAAALHLVPWPQSAASVVVISANFVLVSLVLSFAANYLVRGATATAEEERRLRNLLELMLREIEHRVKNNLQVISSLVNLKAHPGADSSSALVEVKESLSAISVVHKLLYRKEAFYLVELGEVLKSLVERLGLIHDRIEFSFIWQGDCAEIDGDRAVSLGLLANEIILNSIKHAFPDGRDGRISVSGQYDAREGDLVIELEDNGIGLVNSRDRERGSGLSIIEALSRQLGATMERSGPPGLRYRFAMKLEKPVADLRAALAPMN
ncbi:MAG TPA: sensor histidine kinase [Rectinemataceae bacterium]|nr:sensor histidine kinase [Rectinemataceae bacterium]